MDMVTIVGIGDRGDGAEPSWSQYGNAPDGTRQAGSSRITAATVGGLRPLWRFSAGGPVTGTPAIADGMVYIGSYDGTLYALDAQTGQSRWEYATRADAFERDMRVPLGISGSAAISGDNVIVGDANAVLHAVDPERGNVVWRTSVEAAPNGSIWSSPVVW